jgi:isopentenyl-diphosphate delta-isomerase
MDSGMNDLLILVDEQDNEIGYDTKYNSHIGKGKLHRSFSIFIANDKNEILMQKRAKDKFLFSGYWSNSCCSHPRKEEKTEEAVHRRLEEELGFDCQLSELFSFVYFAPDKNGAEHELDHVFVGRYNGPIKPNPAEVEEVKWINADELVEDVKKNPDKYTVWCKIALDRVVEHFKNKTIS